MVFLGNVVRYFLENMANDSAEREQIPLKFLSSVELINTWKEEKETASGFSKIDAKFLRFPLLTIDHNDSLRCKGINVMVKQGL